ncbi:MAG TPA: polysaccharide biosynthesis/export family protein [Caulobacteraceae bacterium]|nr:polysaccharide biosynthesis/export family protein [Caulobacteraceae bacterium]
MIPRRRLMLAAAASALAVVPAAGLAARPRPQPFVNIPYANWTADEPPYRLYPGDQLEVTVPSAPELSAKVTVQPDGRIELPLIGPQMAADRTAPQLEAELARAYSSQLLRPQVEVAVKAQPLKVFVGGEVGKPGVYDMPGDIDALRAIIEAGGFLGSGKRSQVVIIRRGPDGRAMMRTVDLSRPFKNAANPDLVPLRRFDVVYVPRNGLAEIDAYMAGLRDLLPFNFSYATGGAAIY